MGVCNKVKNIIFLGINIQKFKKKGLNVKITMCFYVKLKKNINHILLLWFLVLLMLQVKIKEKMKV